MEITTTRIGVILLGLVTMFVLSSCSNNADIITKTLVFAGEGEYWSGEFTQEPTQTWEKDDNNHETYEGSYKSQFVLTYNGSDAEDIASVAYECIGSSPTSEQTGEVSAPFENKNTMIENRTSGNGATFREENIFTVTVQWDGNTETFEMPLIESSEATPAD